MDVLPGESAQAVTSSPIVSLRVPIHIAALVVVLFLTSLNGLYNALNVQYGGKHTSFLPLADDRHADLVKTSLSMPPNCPDYLPRRDHAYWRQYKNNPYAGYKGVDTGELTVLHVPPLMLLIFLSLKPALVLLGPGVVVRLYYFAAFCCVAVIALKFRNNWKEGLLLFVLLTLTYPFLMILCRANAGALISSICLIFFIYELLSGKRVIVAALLLALAFNCRPNVILLTPLFLVLGWRACLRGALVFGFAASILFAICYRLDTRLYPGYDFTVFQKALKIFYKKYVFGKTGSFSNNTAYGAIWPLVRKLHFSYTLTHQILIWAQRALTPITLFLIGLFSFYYLRRAIDKYAFAFSLSATYILGSTFLYTYHLFFMAIFIVILARPSFKIGMTRSDYLILIASALMLAPKNYLYRKGISFEVIINPFLLLCSLVLIFLWRTRLKSTGRFWDTLHWNGEEIDAAKVAG